MKTIFAIFACIALASASILWSGPNDLGRDHSTAWALSGQDCGTVGTFSIGGAFTIQTWISVGSLALNGKGGTVFFTSRAFADGGSGNQIKLSVDNISEFTFTLVFQDPVSGTTYAPSISANYTWVRPATFHMLSAIVRASADNTGTQLCLRLDGTESCSGIFGFMPSAIRFGAQQKTSIGCNVDKDFLVGALDEFRIWNQGFSGRDFDYSELSGQDERLLAFWRFDEGLHERTSPVAHDTAGDSDMQMTWGANQLGGFYPPCNFPDTIAKRSAFKKRMMMLEECQIAAEALKRSDVTEEQLHAFEARCGGGGGGIGIWPAPDPVPLPLPPVIIEDPWTPPCMAVRRNDQDARMLPCVIDTPVVPNPPVLPPPPQPPIDNGNCGWVETCSFLGDPHYTAFNGAHFDHQHFGIWGHVMKLDGNNVRWLVTQQAGECGFGSASCAEKIHFVTPINGRLVSGWLDGTSVHIATWGVSIAHAEGQVNAQTGLVRTGNCLAHPGYWKFCNIHDFHQGEIYHWSCDPGTPRGVCTQDCNAGAVPAAMFQAFGDKCALQVSTDCRSWTVSPQCNCPACAITTDPSPTCKWEQNFAVDAFNCPVNQPIAPNCPAIVNSKVCTLPSDQYCRWDGMTFLTVNGRQTNCIDQCGTVVSKTTCPPAPTNCKYINRQMFQDTPCIVNCGTLTTTLDCSTPKCPGTGWRDNQVLFPGSQCITDCGIERCPCEAFDVKRDCPAIPATCSYVGCNPETNVFSPFFRATGQPCCTCGVPTTNGLDCSEVKNCRWEQRQWDTNQPPCITSCGVLVSNLQCQAPTNCHFENPEITRGCKSECGTLVSDFGTCEPPQFCKFDNPTVTFERETGQSCTTDCGTVKSILTCNPPPGCWYEDTDVRTGTTWGGKQYQCIADCGTLRCECPDVGTCVPPSPDCQYINVPQYQTGVYARKNPADSCKMDCGTLNCPPPVPANNCTLCQNLPEDIKTCHGQEYYDCSVALCNNATYTLNDPVLQRNCLFDRCIMGITFAGVDTVAGGQRECNKDVCDASCWDLEVCPNMCGGPCAGECTPNGCVCKPGYTGIDCTTEVGSDCFTFSSPALATPVDYLPVERAQTATDFVNGVCDTTENVNCAMLQGLPAPVFPGSVAAWLFHQRFVQDTSNWAFGMFVNAPQVDQFGGKYKLVGQIVLSNGAADGTDLSKLVPVAYPLGGDSVVTATASADKLTMTIDFTLNYGTRGVAGVLIDKLPFSGVRTSRVQVKFAGNQQHGLDKLHVLNGDGSEGSTACAMGVLHMPLDQVADANTKDVSFSIAASTCDKGCTAHADCESCQADANCGWCSNTQVCLAGDASGPIDVAGTSSCQEWRYRSTEQNLKRSAERRALATDLTSRVVTHAISATEADAVRTESVRVLLAPSKPLSMHALLTLPCDLETNWQFDLHMLVDVSNQGSNAAMVRGLAAQARALVRSVRSALSPTRFSVFVTLSVFSDVATPPFGLAGTDTPFQRVLGRIQIDDTGMLALEKALAVALLNGGDAQNAQLTAIQSAIDQLPTTSPAKTLRYVVVFTGTPFHTDRVSPSALASSLLLSNFIPIFIVHPSVLALYTDLVQNQFGFGYAYAVAADWSDVVSVTTTALLTARNSFQLVRDDAGAAFIATKQAGQLLNLLPGTTVPVPYTMVRAGGKRNARNLDDVFTQAFTMYVPGYGSFPVRVGLDDRPLPLSGAAMNVQQSIMRDESIIARRTIRLTRTRSLYADSPIVDTYIDTLPAHGKLYQWKSTSEVGAEITTVPALVEDFVNLRVVYHSDWLYYGNDTFTYHAEDNCGYDSPSGTVSLIIKYFNYPPTCVACTAFVKEDDSVQVAVNATNVDTPFDKQVFAIWTNSTDSRLTVTGPAAGTNNVFTVKPAQYTFGDMTFTYEATDPQDPEPASSGPCACTVTVDHVNHCPFAKTVVTKTGLYNNITIDLGLTDVDPGDPQRIFITSLPAQGTLHQCSPATFAVSLDDSLSTLCLPGASIAVNDQVAAVDGLFRVVYLPPQTGSGGFDVTFQWKGDDFPVGQSAPETYKHFCLYSDTTTPTSTATISVDTVPYPEPPFPSVFYVDGWEDSTTIVTFRSKTVSSWTPYVRKSIAAALGTCTQMDGTPIDAAPASPVQVTDAQKRIQCTWTPMLHGNKNQNYALSAIEWELRDTQWSVAATLSVSVWPVNHAPVAGAPLAVSTFETPDAQFQPQPYTPIVLQASDADVDPAVQTLQFRIVSVPLNGFLYDSDMTTVLNADSVLQQSVNGKGTATVYYRGDAYFHGGDSFSFQVEDGKPCGAPTGTRPVSPCNPTSNRASCAVWSGEANGCSAVFSVSIDVAHVNHPPFAVMSKPFACESEENIICVSGIDNDNDALPAAFIQSLPLNGKLMAVTTQDVSSRTEITQSMLPFRIGASSNVNGSAAVIGCFAYEPPTAQFGLNLDQFSYTVSDEQPLNSESQPLVVPIDVYTVYAPPSVVPTTFTAVGDKPTAIRLGVFDEFNTPNRTYVTRVLSMPSKGTLLNADSSPIVADANGQFWLSNPFEVVFVPTFNESGSPYTAFTVEVYDQALIGVTAQQFQTLQFGTQTELGSCTIYRPTTGAVVLTVDVEPVNHLPQLSTTAFSGLENTLTTLQLQASDVDNDAIVMILQALPAKGFLYTVAPPAVNACGAVPDYGTPLTASSVGQVILPDAGTKGTFTLYYYAAANDYGLDYATVQAVFYDKPNDLSLVSSYPVDVITVDIAHVNQPPTLFFNGVAMSPLVPVTVGSFGRFNFSTADSDLAGGQLKINVTCEACTIDWAGTVAAAGSSVQFNMSSVSDTFVQFRARVTDANALLSNLRVKSAAKTAGQTEQAITVVVDDMGQNGEANPRCPAGSATRGRVVVNPSSRANVVAAISGAAAGGVAVAAAAGAALAAAGWLAARRSNLLDTAAVPFEDEYSAGTTVSPIYQAGAVGGMNPIMATKAETGAL